MTRPAALVQNAVYASNVFHYQHVVQAMNHVAANVTLARRFEVSREMVDRLRRSRAPIALVRLLERRAVSAVPGVSAVGIGAAQFVMPLMARMPSLNTSRVIEEVIRSESRQVARKTGGAELFQFVEGLGHASLDKRSFPIAICERRHLHHAVLESDPGTVGTFPTRIRSDPIGSILDFEYSASDAIMVYSDVARQSFIDRGFVPSRVFVAPLGFEIPSSARSTIPRDAHMIAFVGRGDVHKGLDVAVEAVRSLGAPYFLEVAGPASEEVRAWLGRQSHVRYRGILNRAELHTLYATTCALVAPSIESFGYAALEGASLGARLVCATTTGAREFIPADSHLVVSGRDPDVWAAAIIDAQDQLSPIDASSSVRDALQDLSWQASASRVASLYSSLMA